MALADSMARRKRPQKSSSQLRPKPADQVSKKFFTRGNRVVSPKADGLLAVVWLRPVRLYSLLAVTLCGKMLPAAMACCARAWRTRVPTTRRLRFWPKEAEIRSFSVASLKTCHQSSMWRFWTRGSFASIQSSARGAGGRQ